MDRGRLISVGECFGRGDGSGGYVMELFQVEVVVRLIKFRAQLYGIVLASHGMVAPLLAASSAASLPGMPQCEGTQVRHTSIEELERDERSFQILNTKELDRYIEGGACKSRSIDSESVNKYAVEKLH